MKRDYMKWAMPILVCCMLSACGNDENGLETPTAKTLTFGVNIKEASAPSSRSVEWEYEDSYTKDKTLKLIWDEQANEIELLHYKATSTFWGATPYTGSLNVADGKKTVSVTINDWTENDGIVAIYPRKDTYTVSEGKISKLTMPSDFTQTGKTTTHLKDYMYMYGYATNMNTDNSVSGSMTLSHIPAVIRGLVINKSNAARIVKSVEIVPETEFPASMNVTYTKSASGFDIVPEIENSTKLTSIKVTCDNASGTNWNTLQATGATDNTDRLMAYALCFPTATSQDYVFKITATDVDGSNEVTYTSNVVKKAKLANLSSGYYYTFELLLDDELTVTLKEVTPMPGWDNETDL